MPFHTYQVPAINASYPASGVAPILPALRLWVPGDAEEAGDFKEALQLILGYLSDIWKNNRRAANPRLIAEFELTERDSDFNDFQLTLRGMPFLRVEVEITKLPNDSDVFYGLTQVIHAGWFAFGTQPANAINKTAGGFLLQTGIQSPKYSRLQYLNFGTSCFYPQSAEETGFMVKLKPGVEAAISVFSEDWDMWMDVECGHFLPTAPMGCDAQPDNWSNANVFPFSLHPFDDPPNPEKATLQPGFIGMTGNPLSTPFGEGNFVPPLTDAFGQPLRLAIPDQNGVFDRFTGPAGLPNALLNSNPLSIINYEVDFT